MNKNDFEYKYVAPTSEERKEIESIRKSYIAPPQKDTKIEFLRKLDAKVKNIPTILALVLGICGIMIFGLGMAMVLEWKIIVWGVVVSAVGIVPMAFAYPAYLKSSKHLKEKYSDEIIKISDELLNDK